TGDFVNNVLVVSSSGGAGNFAGTIPDALTWSYQFVRQGNDWVVNAVPNKNFGPIASIGGSTAAIATAFQQPASSYVGTKSNAMVNELFCGTWARSDFSKFTMGTASAVSFNGSLLANLGERQQVSYSGFQGGVDCGLLRFQGTTWDVHVGATGGEIDGTISQTNGAGTTDVRIPFFGAYAFFRNGGYVLDLSVRHDLTNAKITVPLAGLNKTSTDGEATTYAAYTSYGIQLQDNLFLTP